MIFFFSDTHFNETRITPRFNPFFRPFKSVDEQNEYMIEMINETIDENDEFYHLGDVSVDVEGIAYMDRIKCRNRTLILGNYDLDTPEKRPLLEKAFDGRVYDEILRQFDGVTMYLNHYPIKGAKHAKGMPYATSLVGHIHSLWKVQRNMINVGVDAWHFRPVSLTEIMSVIHAMNHHYDENVFPC
jgi:calcineurin-like phosphoesterase family protein